MSEYLELLKLIISTNACSYEQFDRLSKLRKLEELETLAKDAGGWVEYELFECKKSFAMLEASAAKNNPLALNAMGLVYEFGDLQQPKDHKKAVEFYERGVRAGNCNAINNLASYYENDLVFSQDFKKAFELYEQAAKMGNLNAMCNLSHAYQNGIGVEQNTRKGYEWCVKAADLGNINAQDVINFSPENKLIAELLREIGGF